jgi:hypothetical protein
MPIILDGSQGITSPTYGGSVTAEYSVPVTAFKNRIINPAMQIDQRNAGASVTNDTGVQYGTDRFLVYGNGIASKFTFQQNAGSVTPPTGFTNYLGFTSSAATTVGSGDIYEFLQRIEGLNVADLGWGTANAASVTLSFWVRSSLTGAFGGAISNSANNRSYPFSYTISSANTWEQKTITISGDTTGTWLTTNGTGIQVIWSLGVGATFQGTANTWAGAGYYSATGTVNLVATNGATLYITGVQLEKGSTATSFDYRPYGTELSLCQRYYWKTFVVDTAPAQNVAPGNQVFNICTNNISNGLYFPVSMRATPTITTFNPYAANASFRVPNSATDVAVTPSELSASGIGFFTMTRTAPSALHGQVTAVSEL